MLAHKLESTCNLWFKH